MPADLAPEKLTPQVKGRLAGTELNIIEAVRAGTVYRITISLDSPIALAAVRAADAENREFSNFVTVALIDRCGQQTAPAADLAEFMAKVQAAAAASPRIVTRLEAALRRELRTKKTAA